MATFICDPMAIPETDWNKLEKWEQGSILNDAYADKRFLECEKHEWELEIAFGSVSVDCTRCFNSYSKIDPDYLSSLCFDVPLYKIEWVESKFDVILQAQ